MTHREKVKAAISYLTPYRIPVHEDFWEDTLFEWKKQGLPEYVVQYPDHKEGSQSITDYFDFDIARIFLDCSPRFEQRIVDRVGEFYTFEDRYGYTAKKSYGKSGSIHFLDNVTRDRDVWERIKHRWVLSDDPDEPARVDDRIYFEHFDPYPSWAEAKKRFDTLYATDSYILCMNYGPWEGTWRHRGLTNLLMDIALDPEWVVDMAKTHMDLSKKIMKKAISGGIVPNGYFMVEDLGSSNGPLISPQMWRDTLKPLVADLGVFLKANSIDFWMHSCGNAEPLFDDLIECGVKVMNPLQVSAGIDIVELKEKYAGKLAFFGNRGSHLLDGPSTQLELEIKRRLEAFRGGGFVFHSDHSVPPTVSLERYRWILDTVLQYSI